MFRRLIPIALTASLSAFAQYGGGIGMPGGIQLPGTTYPGGGYPGQGGTYPGQGGTYPGQGGTYPGQGGQYPGQGGTNRGQQGMGQILNGNVRQISPTNLAIETDDSRILMMQVQQNARLNTNMGRGRWSDFDPGDYVTVNATQDMNGYYYANVITLNRKGTPQERSSASQPLNTSMHSGNQGQSSKNDSDDSDRPVMRRADTTATKADDSSASDDDGRPHMRRADSAGGTSSGGSPSSAPADSSASAGAVRPQVTQGDPIQTASNSTPARPMTDDPGPPTMRRGAAPRDQSASEAVPSRPSVQATEVNGVTQIPSAPPPVATGSMRDGMAVPSGAFATNDTVIDQAREEAFAFTETLPNYVVKQFTTRYQSDSASRGKTSWQAMDIVTADVVAENGKETYKNLMVNGKPTKDIEKSGSWSEGEFASTLQAILSPGSDALFTGKRSTTIVNRAAYRYDYAIEQPRSNWRVEYGGSTYRPAYGGAIWIDKETSRVLRIEMSARNVPRDFGLDAVESTVDYDFVLIGTKKYLLPVHSEALSCMRGTTECTRNVIDFRNYRKFGADTSISFEDAGK